MIPFVLDRVDIFPPGENILKNVMFFKNPRKQKKLDKARIP